MLHVAMYEEHGTASCGRDESAMVNSAIGVGGGLHPPPTLLYQHFGTPLDGNFKLYINNCHRYPVNIFVINMVNSLLRLLIVFDMFDELQ